MALGITGGPVGRAVVEMVGDTAKLRDDFRKAHADTDRATSGMSKSATTFSTVAKVAWAAAGAAAVAFVASSIQAFAEHQVVVARLQTTIERTPALVGASVAAFEEEATALQNLTGVQDEEILAADAVLARFQLTQDQISDLIPLVLDYARVVGIDASTASTNIGRALLGNARALKTLGVDYKATGDRAKDYDAILAILESRVAGQAVAFGETLPGKLDIASAKYDDVKEQIGESLAPALEELLELGSASAEVMGPVLGTAFETLGEAIGPVVAMLQPVIDLLHLAGVGAEETGTSAKEAADGGNLLSDALGFVAAGGRAMLNPIGNARDRLRDLGGFLGIVVDEAENAAGSQDQLSAAMRESAVIAAEEADQVNQLAVAHSAAAAAALEEWAAELQLAGGMLGVQGAALSAEQAEDRLADARREVSDLTDAGKRGTEEYRDAMLDLAQAELAAVQSQRNIDAAVQSYANDLLGPVLDAQKAYEKALEQDGPQAAATQAAALADLQVALSDLGPRQKEAERDIRAMGRAAGLSKGQIDTLVEGINDEIEAAGRVPREVRTRFIGEGLQEEIGSTQQLYRNLQDIDGKSSEYQIVETRIYRTEYQQFGAPGAKAPSAAGALALYGLDEGAIVTKPMIIGRALVAEGSYPTRFGRGAEGVLPLTDDVFAKIGEGIAAASGAGTDPAAIEGAVERAMIRAMSHMPQREQDIYLDGWHVGRALSRNEAAF
jgi:hypothetical protein